MSSSSELVFFACWISEGRWEFRVDEPRLPNGKRHVHIRRRRKRKGEYSWNEDGSRHDKGKFPVDEEMIEKAKEIAANKLGVSAASFELLTSLPEGGSITVLHDDLPWFAKTYIFGGSEQIVLLSDDWLVLIASYPEGGSRENVDQT